MGYCSKKFEKQNIHRTFKLKGISAEDFEDIAWKCQVFGGTALLNNGIVYLTLKDTTGVEELKDLVISKETKLKKMYCYVNDFCEDCLTIDKDYLVIEEPLGGTFIYHTLDVNNKHYNTMLERFR